MTAPRRRAHYAGRADQAPLTVRLNEQERERLEAKARIAGIPPRSGHEDTNLSEAARQAIEAWSPTPPPPEPVPEEPGAPRRRRVTVEG